MTGGPWVRAYRSLLRVLPPDFRARRSDDLTRLFEMLVEDARLKNGRRGAWSTFARESADVIWTGIRLRLGAGADTREGRMGASMWDLFRHDTKLAVRGLWKDRGFSTVVILTLALGIGATTAIFSVVDGVLIRPLPFADPDRLVVVWENDRETGTLREPGSWPDYVDLREMNRTLVDIAAFATRAGNLTREGGDPQRVDVASVTHNVAEVLGVAPALGRGIEADEARPGGAKVAVLTDGFWAEAFGRDPSALGSTLILDDEPHTIVGVLPPGSEYPDEGTDLWVPLQTDAEITPRYTHPFGMVARLSPESSVEAAQADVTRIMAELETLYPGVNEARGGFVEPLQTVIRGDLSTPLLILFGAVFTVLLVACANVANLFLARGARRTQELAVATAMGATAGRLARRFVVESVLITGGAAVAGLLLAVVGLRAILAVAPAELLAAGDVTLHRGVLGFTVVVAVAVGLLFALVPARQARKLDLQSALKEGRSQAGAGGMEKLRARRALVVTQMAMAMVLLVGAGLLIHSLYRIQQVDPGFHTEGILRVTYQLPQSRYPRDFAVYPRWQEVHAFNDGLIERARALPGVQDAAVVSNHSLDRGFTNSFLVIGREDESADWGELTTRLVGPGYFGVTGLRVTEGRPFDSSDDAEAPPVVLVNRAAVERYFPEHQVIGAQLRFWGTTREIVGIVENERLHGLTEDTPPAMYVSMLQAPQVGAATLMVRTSLDPMLLVDPVRQAVRELDPAIPVYNVATMDETLARSLGRERFTSLLFGLFAGVGLLIAVIGVHGVLSYVVAQRGHEVGVRMALGASRSQVRRMVVRQGMVLALGGMAVGLVAALALSRVMTGLLFGVTAMDPLTYGVVAVVLAGAALVASALPARRATSIDPVVALRSE